MSQADGTFVLVCPEKNPGDRVFLNVGATDGQGQAIELVNQHQLDYLTLPAWTSRDTLWVIVCPQEQVQAATEKYYRILRQASETAYEEQLAQLNARLAADALSQEERRLIYREMDDLKRQYADDLVRARDQARFIASINLDQASELVREAVEALEKYESVDHSRQVKTEQT